jgi:stage II sporulation protein D
MLPLWRRLVLTLSVCSLIATPLPAAAQQGEFQLLAVEPEAPLPASIVRVTMENHTGRAWPERLFYSWGGAPEGVVPVLPAAGSSARALVIPTPAKPGATRLTIRAAAGALPSAEIPVTLTGFYVDGRGNGHGLGMSQWGARGRSVAGEDYRGILAAYYANSRIETRDTNFTVRVKLQHGTVDLSDGWPPLFGKGPRVWGPARVSDVGELGADAFLEWFVRGGHLATRLVRGAREVTTYDRGNFEITPLDAGFGVRTNLMQIMDYGFQPLGEERRYRGSLRVVPAGGGRYELVNTLPFEDYLKGVVPSEMPSFWLPHALRAQAVAARTYALRRIGGGRGTFDVEATEYDQVYGGINAERRSSTDAVEATRGQVLMHGGALVDALFMSSGGGRTENSENGFVQWNGRVVPAAGVPYLRSTTDPLDPYPGWRVGPYSPGEAATLLRDRGFNVGGQLRAVELLDRGVSGRVLAARLVGDARTITISGPRLRYALGLPDTLIEVHGP